MGVVGSSPRAGLAYPWYWVTLMPWFGNRITGADFSSSIALIPASIRALASNACLLAIVDVCCGYTLPDEFSFVPAVPGGRCSTRPVAYPLGAAQSPAKTWLYTSRLQHGVRSSVPNGGLLLPRPLPRICRRG